MSSSKNFRITIILSNFFHDHRNRARIFVNENFQTITDLQEHIKTIFNINNFHLTSQNEYLPPTEDIRILQKDDIIWVVQDFPSQTSTSKGIAATERIKTKNTAIRTEKRLLSPLEDYLEQNFCPPKKKKKKKHDHERNKEDVKSLNFSEECNVKKKNEDLNKKTEINTPMDCEEIIHKRKKAKKHEVSTCQDVRSARTESVVNKLLPEFQSHISSSNKKISNKLNKTDPTLASLSSSVTTEQIDSPIELHETSKEVYKCKGDLSSYKKKLSVPTITDKYLKDKKVNIVKIEYVSGGPAEIHKLAKSNDTGEIANNENKSETTSNYNVGSINEIMSFENKRDVTNNSVDVDMSTSVSNNLIEAEEEKNVKLNSSNRSSKNEGFVEKNISNVSNPAEINGLNIPVVYKSSATENVIQHELDEPCKTPSDKMNCLINRSITNSKRKSFISQGSPTDFVFKKDVASSELLNEPVHDEKESIKNKSHTTSYSVGNECPQVEKKMMIDSKPIIGQREFDLLNERSKALLEMYNSVRHFPLIPRSHKVDCSKNSDRFNINNESFLNYKVRTNPESNDFIENKISRKAVTSLNEVGSSPESKLCNSTRLELSTCSEKNMSIQQEPPAQISEIGYSANQSLTEMDNLNLDKTTSDGVVPDQNTTNSFITSISNINNAVTETDVLNEIVPSVPNNEANLTYMDETINLCDSGRQSEMDVTKNVTRTTDSAGLSSCGSSSTHSRRKQLSGIGNLLGELRANESLCTGESVDSDNSEFVTKRKRKRVRKRKKNKESNSSLNDSSVILTSDYVPRPSKNKARPTIHLKFEEDDRDDLKVIDVNKKDNQSGRENESYAETSYIESVTIESDVEESEGKFNINEEHIVKSPSIRNLLPRIGDIIAFKILRITENYTPDISSYIIGKVVEFNPDTKFVLYDILNGLEQCEELHGRFTLGFDESIDNPEVTKDNKREFAWKDVIDPRLLFP